MLNEYWENIIIFPCIFIYLERSNHLHNLYSSGMRFLGLIHLFSITFFKNWPDTGGMFSLFPCVMDVLRTTPRHMFFLALASWRTLSNISPRLDARRLRERVNRRFYAPAKRSATNVSIPLRGRHALIYEINTINLIVKFVGGKARIKQKLVNCLYSTMHKIKFRSNNNPLRTIMSVLEERSHSYQFSRLAWKHRMFVFFNLKIRMYSSYRARTKWDNIVPRES